MFRDYPFNWKEFHEWKKRCENTEKALSLLPWHYPNHLVYPSKNFGIFVCGSVNK